MNSDTKGTLHHIELWVPDLGRAKQEWGWVLAALGYSIYQSFFQHWEQWRPLVVETARRVLEFTGGILVMPMTVLVESYWREISDGLTKHGIPIRHFVLHADQETLRDRIQNDKDLGPSTFRFAYLEPYADAARTWLHNEAEVIDTTDITPDQAAQQIADSLLGY